MQNIRQGTKQYLLWLLPYFWLFPGDGDGSRVAGGNDFSKYKWNVKCSSCKLGKPLSPNH